MSALSAEELIRELQLAPHPEGGWYCESYRDTQASSD
ncbi:MAG: cupin domain-containing protein, partial [Hyphomicrobiales bacterium]|nr:cupin domain-containing protein [Hyphomicrobiales bacterium]